ncbi:MAG: glycosyltransferase family 2 protein [candidate division WOR-3 bacterium]|jgi:glycosyltransferase involved in cell wall biosynthesis
MGFTKRPLVSVIVPAYNEAENIEPLLAELAAKLDENYEVIIVDDGSTDRTFAIADAARCRYPFLSVIRLPKNQGKTAAVVAGFKRARGDFVCIFDADLQFSPDDIKLQVEILKNGYDLVTGRKVGRYEKKTISRIYNFLARRLFGLKVHDINALKTFRREVLAGMVLRKDWHRYIVPLAAVRGFSITEVPVELRPRYAGKPKYSNPWRIVIGFLDLLAVGFQVSFMRKPMLYFGTIGFISLLAGFITGVIAVILRLCGHGFRPLLYLVILLALTGLLFFAAGFLGEAIASVNDRLEIIEQAVRPPAVNPTDRKEREE